MSLEDGPLAGLRVLEFGQLLAGPYVGTLLGDFGADVVKVEAPGAGDAMRDWGRLRHNGHSLWWAVLARNKRSVTLNLREERGQEIARELAATADVVLENFRPGTMERWGLGPEDVHAVNPRAIYARVTGYGQTGRYRERAGFAAGGEAISGLRYINGYPDQAPPRTGISLGDTIAAQSAFQGILLALYARDARGGTGQVVDASIADACFAMMESAVVEYEKTGFIRQPTGPRLPRIAPSNVYRAKDGKWVVIAANHDTLWKRLANVMGHPEYADDPRFATHHGRGENEDLLDEIIGAFAAAAHGGRARPDRQRRGRRLRAGVHGPGHLRGPLVPRARPARRARGRGARRDVDDGRRAEAVAVTPGSIRSGARWTTGRRHRRRAARRRDRRRGAGTAS